MSTPSPALLFRHETIDHILDLTLAFEIAVSCKGEQAPQSWKVSVRSAQMIGGPLPDRQGNRRKMSALLLLRISPVAGGFISTTAAGLVQDSSRAGLSD